jgi:hypothetical protein
VQQFGISPLLEEDRRPSPQLHTSSIDLRGGCREKVIQQVNRPTFERMKPSLVEVCRYISFEGLHEALAAARYYVSFLKPGAMYLIAAEARTPGHV